MKTVPGFTIRPLAREFILVAEGPKQVNFNKMISLNATAAFLWKEVDGRESFTVEDLADLLCGEYEVDRETALRDSQTLARKWIEAGIAVE